MKVVISDYSWPSINIEKEFFKKNNIELVVSNSNEDLIDKIKDADGLLFCFADINENVLRAATNLKVAQRYGIGVDNININIANELGVVVANIPDYCIDEVSDHALSMILSLNRMLAPHSSMVKKGKWAEIVKSQRVYRLSEATLGIVGFGRIGRRLATKCQSLGINIVSYDPLVSESQIDGVEMVSFDELLLRSNIISLHVPLTESTYHMISDNQLSMMVDDVILINVSRGGLIDEAVLATYLDQGKVRGVGLDEIEDHSPDATNPLFNFENVMITPHTAFFSQESTQELQIRACDQILRVLNGQKPEFFINPEVLNHNKVNLS